MTFLRLRRRSFWWVTSALWLGFFALRAQVAPETSPVLTTALAALMLVALVLACVARLHDRGLRGWALTAAAAPVLGALWLVIELALRGGDRGDNRYGPDPRSDRQ